MDYLQTMLFNIKITCMDIELCLIYILIRGIFTVVNNHPTKFHALTMTIYRHIKLFTNFNYGIEPYFPYMYVKYIYFSKKTKQK